MTFKKTSSMERYNYLLIIGYINLWPTYAICSEFVNGFSLAWYLTLSEPYIMSAVP